MLPRRTPSKSMRWWDTTYDTVKDDGGGGRDKPTKRRRQTEQVMARSATLRCLSDHGYRTTRIIAQDKHTITVDTMDSVVIKLGKIYGFEIQMATLAASLRIGLQIYNAFSCRVPILGTEIKELETGYVIAKGGPSLADVIRRGLTDDQKDELYDLALKCVRNGVYLNGADIVSIVDDDGDFYEWRATNFRNAGEVLAKLYNELEYDNYDKDYILDVSPAYRDPLWRTVSRVDFLKEMKDDAKRTVREFYKHQTMAEWRIIFKNANMSISFIRKLEAAMEAEAATRSFAIETLLVFDFKSYIRRYINIHRDPDRATPHDADDFVAEIHRLDDEAKRKFETLMEDEFYGFKSFWREHD